MTNYLVYRILIKKSTQILQLSASCGIIYMNKYLRLIYLLLLLICFNPDVVKAQADYGSEEEFKKQAAKLFNEEEFVKAYPLYTQLVSLYKKDPDYNYRLGVCMIYADADKEKSIPYLEFALKSPDEIEKEAHFYLAKAYHLNYRFDDAIARYKTYKKVASGAKAERLQVDRQIEMCANGKKLLQNISDLQVIDKTEMGREDFFRTYDVSGIGGKLLVKPDEKEFKTALDKKKKESTIIYLAQNGGQIYFSSYGENEKNGKDIYLIKKTSSGEWGKQQVLGPVINTKYDEDYPFLHPDGKTLYFCSKGHNSMGGYDIFKSTLNAESGEWGPPVNLDFPINTPDDDILYLTDKEEKKAYFSSSRTSEAGKISVYHINVERKPIDFVIIKGAVIKNRKDQALNAKITIKNLTENNMIVGMFNAQAENGAYDIKLPNGGRFLYTVEAPGFLPQSEVVEVPVQKEFRALRQEISYEQGTDKLVIKNLFDATPSDTSYLLAINLIKEKSKLDVGVIVPDFAATEPEKAENGNDTSSLAVAKAATTTAVRELSNEDIVRIAYRDAKESEAEAKEVREQADISLAFANQKNDFAQAKALEVSDLMDKATKEEDRAKKQTLTERATAANKEAEELNQETVVAFNIAKKIDATALAKQEEADLSMQYAKGLEAAVKSDNSKESVAKMDELEKKLEALNQSNSTSMPIINSYKKDEENKRRELDKAVQESADLKQDRIDNETIIAGLKADAENEKNDKIKEGLNNQIAELVQENIDKQKQLEENELRVAKLQKEYIGVKSDLDLVSSVVNQSQTTDSEAAAANAASIDRDKLEQQVNAIKSKTEANNTSIVQTTGGTQPVKTDSVSAATTVMAKNPLDTSEVVSDAGPGTNFVYKNSAASTQIAEADILEKEANDLLAESISYRVEPGENTSKAEQKEKRKKGEELAKQAQEKKDIAAQLYAQANKAEYTTNQKQLDESAKANSASTSPDLFKAELLNDESKKYFDLGQEERKRAKAAKSYSEKEAALDAAKSNELIALEKQREASEIYKNFTPSTPTTTVAQVTPVDTAGKITTAVVATQPAVVEPATSEAVMSGINTKFESDLAATQTIQNEADREKAKADVLKNWAEAIDADLAKQKQDYEATTDSQKKELIAKRMRDAENNSKEKQTLAAQSRTKAEALQQQPVAVVTSPGKADPVMKPANTEKADTTRDLLVSNNDLSTNDTTALYEYNDPVANAQIEKAVMLNDQADAMLAESIIPQLETTEPISEEESKKRKEAAQKMIAEAQAKKLESAQLVATANTSEYTKKQTELEQVAKATSGSKAGDVLKAELLKDEAQKHFDLASQERKKAAQTSAYYEKEMMLQDAHENELLALKKQNESLALYKSNTPATVASTNTGNIPNTTNTTNANSVPAVATTTNPVRTTTNPETNSANTTNTKGSGGQLYSTPSAMEQSVKAASLNKEAEDIMTLSLDLKTQAIAQSNSDAKNSMYAQSEELMKEARSKKTEAARLVANANSTEYRSNDVQVKQYKKASVSDNSGDALKAEILNDEAEGLFNKAKTLRQEAAAMDSYYAKEAILEDATTSEMQALKKQKESIALYKNLAPPVVAATNTPKNTSSTTETPKTTIKPTTTVSPANNTVAVSSRNTPEVVLTSNEVFEQKTTPVYSSKNPIPIDAKLPEGLIFKVQIGAFRKPIPQNLFKGMAPITGETTPKGYIRYTAGIFTKFSNADKVKKQIIDMGYKDAFVVAFLNGRRIPINEAYALSEGTPSTVLEVNTQLPGTTQVASNQDDTNKPNEVIKSQNVTDVGGLFYTVQVGVFSQPVIAAKLYSMSPLFNEKTSNGYLRYYTGVYTNVARANEAKDIVVDIGIKDAFVTAYYNGKRVSIPEAQTYEAQGSKFPTSSDVNKLPSFKAVAGQGVPPKTPTATQEPANNAVSQQSATATVQNTSSIPSVMPAGPGIVYKVQIGAFYEEVPLEMANKFIKIARKGIQNYKDKNGLTIYTVGDVKSYDEANTLKAQVIAEAQLTDAFVVAYRDGEKIPVEDAKQSK